MKKKILSFTLLVAMLVSFASIFAFAAEPANNVPDAQSEGAYVKDYVHLRQSFGDQFDDYGSMGNVVNAGTSTFSTAYERSGNAYGQFYVDGVGNVYLQQSTSSAYSPSTSNLGYLIYEFDINDFGKLLDTRSFFEIITGSTTRKFATQVVNIGNDGTKNYVYAFDNTSNRADIKLSEWNHIRIELSILSSSATTYTCKVVVGDKSFTNNYPLGAPAYINCFRIGSTRTAPQTFGLDNVSIYSCAELKSSYDDIGTLSDVLAMKVGSDNAYLRGTKIDIDNPPMLVGGEVYLPTDAVELYARAKDVANYTVTLDGVDYVHINDLAAAYGEKASYDDMGLVIIGESCNSYNRDDDIDLLINLMKKFIFDIPSPDDVKNDVASYTSNQHPYLLADADRFAYLRGIYEKGQKSQLTDSEELTLYSYITRYLTSASSSYNSWANNDTSGNYAGLKKKPTNSNYTTYNNNGYDIGGRLSVPSDILHYFAFAYQITGDMNYAKLAYDYSLALGEWNHWGPGHFLNCADAAAPFAIAYDWLYNAYEELKERGEVSPANGEVYDQANLARILFTHAILPGYIQSSDVACPWPRSQADSKYHTKTSNWNAVCSSGMIASCLAIIDQDISTAGLEFETQTRSGNGFKTSIVGMESIGNSRIHVGLSTYSDYASRLITMNLGTMVTYGLSQYVPDGSYIEAAGYWSYGTNTLFRMVATLLSATGDDYGFMDAWGMDKTSYFAVHAESSDYKAWSYHDGGAGAIDTSYIFFVGDYYGDENLVRIRKKQLANGKGYTLTDILYYDTKIVGEPTLERDYYMEGIDGFAIRSSWDKGAIYAGLMGGNNNVSHGQIDAGSFVYHNGGNIWFHDLGADNYNISSGYFGNYKLYVQSAEGHNVICLVDEEDTVPYGQILNSNSPVVDYSIEGDNGSYSIVDTSAAYGSHVKSAKRGMLLTESRTVTVIQDEIVFNGKKSAYWFGHYMLGTGYVDSVRLCPDGRTAFMTQGDKILRVSIVSDDQSLKFEIMDCYTYVLDGTIRTDKSTMGGALEEKSRDQYRKLAIKFDSVESVKLAVVIEQVNSYDTGSSYQWNDMDNWSANSKESEKITTNFAADFKNYDSQTGRVTLDDKDGYYAFNTIPSDKDAYITFGAKVEGVANNAAYLKFIPSSKNPALLNHTKLIALDLDIFTESSFPFGSTLVIGAKSNSSSATDILIAEMYEKNIIFGRKEVDASGGWVRLTAIIDIASNGIYIFADGQFVTHIENALPNNTNKIDYVAIKAPSGTTIKRNGNISIDNMFIRSFGATYDKGEIKGILDSHANLSGWSDNLPSKTEKPAPLAYADGEPLYSYDGIRSAINAGKAITLARDILIPITISGAAIIDTSGYKFKYTARYCIASVDGDVISFKEGSITVSWHIGNSTYTEVYTSSTVASFKGNDTAVNAITERVIENDDGTVKYVYYTTGWANTPGGEALSTEDMIVTEANCEFWLVDNVPASFLYVTKGKDGTIRAGSTEAALRSAISSTNSSYSTIILCSDIVLQNTSIINLPTTGKNIFLNGYTLYHYNDNHLLCFRNNTVTDIIFHGPGKIEKESKSGAILTTDSSTTSTTISTGVVFDGITLSNGYEIVDTRIGQHRFINCVLIQNTDVYTRAMLLCWNKNSAYLSDGVTPINLTTITLDGCEVSRIATAKNTATIFSGTGGYMEFIVKDTTISNNSVIATAQDPLSKLHISGDSKIEATGLVASGKILNATVENGVLLSFIPDESAIPTDSYIARSGDARFIYKVADGFALVSWLDLNGGVILTEKYALGTIPIADARNVADYLASISGNAKYEYNTTVIESNAPISFSPSVKKASEILTNITVHSSFDLNVYIPSDAVFFNIDGKAVDLSALTIKEIDGAWYYRYGILDISASNAARVFTLKIVDESGEVYNEKISVIDYLDRLLSEDYSREAKNLAANAVMYIKSVYVYSKNIVGAEYDSVQQIATKHENAAVVFGSIAEKYTNTGALASAIRSARLYLISFPGYRLSLNPEYTGRITVCYSDVTLAYDVESGRLNGNDYIDFSVPAYCFIDTISITADGLGTINYSLDIYSTALDGFSTEYDNLVFDLYNYASAARAYLEYAEINGAE